MSVAVKRNPVALALTGIAVAWLIMGDKSTDRDRRDYDRRYGGGERSNRYDERHGSGNHVDDHNRRSGLEGRTGTQPSGRSLGPYPSDAQKRYYSGRDGTPDEAPSWARDVDGREGSSVVSNVRDAASSAGESACGAASSVADIARSASGEVTDTAKSMVGGAQSVAASASDRAAALRERLSEGTENLSEQARDRVIAARENAFHARDAAISYAHQGRDRAVDIFEDQPLIAGALAVALGAALGAALPRSNVNILVTRATN